MVPAPSADVTLNVAKLAALAAATKSIQSPISIARVFVRKDDRESRRERMSREQAELH